METTVSTVQVIGNTFLIRVNQLSIRLFFESETRLTFTVLAGGGLVPDGYAETVAIHRVEIRPNVYLVAWKEASGATVTHVEDFDKRVVHTNITLPSGEFYNLQGSLELV